MSLEPWAEGPFELILHGELHFRNGGDFDRRMALISFDNSIEVSIGTYLSLNPMLRGNRQYPRVDVERWLVNYHTKLDFFVHECGSRGVTVQIERTRFVWYHDIRNDQYHSGGPTTPQDRDIRGIRSAALWVFSVLFDVPDPERILEERVNAQITPPEKPTRDGRLDKVIDKAHGLVTVAGLDYYTSELLFGLDPAAYRELGLGLLVEGQEEA